MHNLVAAVTADIVGSRRQSDRRAAQRTIEAAVAQTDPMARPVRPLTATVGDEFQGIYATLADAVRATLVLRLALPGDLDLRFGIGIGSVFGDEDDTISDGPAWWAAREAVDDAHRLQDRGMPRVRTRVVGAVEEDAAMTSEIRLANAYLLARDELVGAMTDRARRLAFGRFLGRTQRELAEAEGISQPAVSQTLSSSGAAAVLAGLTALEGVDR